jgi:fructokinase
MFGEELYTLLQKEGINLQHVWRSDRPTTLAFVSRKPGQGEKYAFFKENAADRALTKDQVKSVLSANKFDAVHMSLGAVTLEDEQMAAAFMELFRTTGQHGSLRTFDPNLRSNMIKGGANAYREKVEGLLRHVDVVKSSDDDIAFLYGDEANFEDVAKKWLEMGPPLVIVTCGAKGAIAFLKGRDTEIAMPPPTTQPNTVDANGKSAPVMDTVGAGDTFMGSTIQGLMGTRKYEFSTDAPLLDQLKRGKAWDHASAGHLRDVLERAALAAAINCSRAGCDPPSSAEVTAAGKVLNLAFAKNL